jgi:hypothetical protein
MDAGCGLLGSEKAGFRPRVQKRIETFARAQTSIMWASDG